MVDVEKYANLVKDSGIKKSFLAERLGISYQGYINKETGKSDFTASEVAVLKDLLHLSNKDVADIFLRRE